MPCSVSLVSAVQGLFPAPTAIAREVEAQYRVQCLGEVPDVRESFYAVTVERRDQASCHRHDLSEARNALPFAD